MSLFPGLLETLCGHALVREHRCVHRLSLPHGALLAAQRRAPAVPRGSRGRHPLFAVAAAAHLVDPCGAIPARVCGAGRAHPARRRRRDAETTAWQTEDADGDLTAVTLSQQDEKTLTLQ